MRFALVVVLASLFLNACTHYVPKGEAPERNAASEMFSKIENEDLRCPVQSGREPMEIVFSHRDQRVWFSHEATSGKDHGGEARITSYKKARCLNCYSVQGKFIGGDFDLRLGSEGPDRYFVQGTMTVETPRGMRTDQILGACQAN